MERLSCTSPVRYNATEAAIHMARYQLAAPYCKGKRVLDVACGEGYGAYALRQLGATSVDGVDNSPQAIANAEALFAKPGIAFHRHDAETVDRLFRETRFDVVVCLETIEHLSDPQRFLRAVQKVAAPSAVIVMTCPNDHWYYPTDDQSNPFHVRKFSFEAFRELTTGVLGNASAWGYGSPVIGFGAFTDELVAGNDPLSGQTAMLDFRAQASAIMLPPRGLSSIGPRNCSYFVGIWGGDAKSIYTSAVVPISMDHYANLVSWEAAQLSPRRLGELESERSQLLADKLQLEQRVLQTQAEATRVQTRSDQVRKEFEAELHTVAVERQSYRIQAFALAKEFDLISTQLRKIGAKRDEYLAELDLVKTEALAISAERDRRVAELDLINTQVREIGAERDKCLAELDLVSTQVREIGDERDRCLTELETARHSASGLTVERDRLLAEQQELRARIAAQEGLRYLTKATSNALRRRSVSTLRMSVLAPARAVKPYLPGPVLSLAQRIARALRF